MGIPYPAEVLKFIMIGDQPFYDRDTLVAVVQGMGKHSLLVPSSWGLDERATHPYDEARIALAATGKSSPNILQLKRKERIQHSTFIRLSKRPGLTMEADHPKPEDWSELFALGDTLAQVYHPEIAWVHGFSNTQPPVTNEMERAQFLLDSAVSGARPKYDDQGPRGLGMRTYFGPHLVDLLGRERLIGSPGVVCELDWGGIRIDLVEQPWDVSQSELLQSWQAAMDHLRPTQVFAEVTQDEKGYAFYKPAQRFVKG